MANILVRKTAHIDRDPFASSDRASRVTSGKGDSPRNISNRFKTNYEQIDWGRKSDTSKESKH